MHDDSCPIRIRYQSPVHRIESAVILEKMSVVGSAPSPGVADRVILLDARFADHVYRAPDRIERRNRMAGAGANRLLFPAAAVHIKQPGGAVMIVAAQKFGTAVTENPVDVGQVLEAIVGVGRNRRVVSRE